MLFPMVQRYKFESKSQQIRYRISPVYGCFQWFKGTNLRANHNTVKERFELGDSCFQWFKGTNLRANHNCFYNFYNFYNAVSNGSKVQI